MASTKSGVIWSAVERFSTQGVSFILSLIIARLVSPSEYGLIAMLMIFMAVAQVFIDSGFGSALIQKKDRTETDFSTVFYFNIAVAGLLYILLYFSSPFIAEFYNQPQLTNISRVVWINLILQSLSTVQTARLNILLDFKSIAKVSLASVIGSGLVGIIAAYHGWGVWALVLQNFLRNFFNTVLLWIVAKWHPLLVFSIKSFRQLFSFGSKLLASGLLHVIYLNMYTLVIGKFYNASDVGYYNRAYSISQYPSTNIVMVLCRAIYPVQCQHQDDSAWLANTFTSYLRMACFIVFPLMCCLAVIAKPLILIILTAKWLPAALPLSILSIAYMWYPVMVINNQILMVKGRSDLFLRAEIIKKIIAVAILCATLPFGVIWLCIGVVIYNVFDMILIIWYTKKVISTSYLTQVKSLLPLILITIASATLAALSMSFAISPILKLCIGFMTFFGIFIVQCFAFKINELKSVIQLLHR